MIEKDLITIIIPVYNVEKYLDKCIESALKQTYRNLEVILVDDGSTDNSGNICDLYKEKDKRVKVYHKKNGGLSSARNYALDRCKGDYIYFLDSDDFIHSQTIEVLYRILVNNQCDITCSEHVGYSDFKMKENKYEKNKYKLTILNREESLQMCNQNILVSSCSKLFKKYIFDKLRFMEGVIYEDAQIAPYIYSKINTIAIYDAPFYYSFERDNSITHSKFSNKNYDIITISEDRVNFYQKEGYTWLYEQSYCFLLGNIVVLYKKAYESHVEKKIKKEILKIYKKNYRKYFSNLYIFHKLKYLSFYLFPNLTLKFIK